MPVLLAEVGINCKGAQGTVGGVVLYLDEGGGLTSVRCSLSKFIRLCTEKSVRFSVWNLHFNKVDFKVFLWITKLNKRSALGKASK